MSAFRWSFVGILFLFPFISMNLLLAQEEMPEEGYLAPARGNGSDCVPEEGFISIVEWYFMSCKVVVVFNLDENKDSQGFQDHFLNRYFAGPTNYVPVVYHKNVPDKNRMWTGRRKTGVLMVTDSMDRLVRLFANISREVIINRNGDFMFTIVSRGEGSAPTAPVERIESELNATTAVMGDFFRRLWKDFNILNTLVVVSFCGSTSTATTDEMVGYYDPFAYVGGRAANPQDELNWGEFKWTTFWALTGQERDYIVKRYVNNFRGYPLKVNQFFRYPTVIERKNIPLALIQSHIYQSIYRPKDYVGFDALILRNMELRLNFTKVNVAVQFDYGWALDNGTFVGSIGEILRKEIDVSFNGRFIKYYDTFDVDFMYPVFFDKFCIVVPKSLRVPQWLAIFQCFDPIVWSVIIVFNIVLGCIWFFTKKILYRISIIHLQKYGENGETFCEDLQTIPRKEIHMMNNQMTMKHRLAEVVLEMWNIMFAAPSFEMPRRNVERILLTACLLANLIITGTFQGSLTTAFSTVTYYQDISTLEELDGSGLPIVVGSKSIMDIFGEDGSPTIQSLARKMTLRSKGSSTSMNITALQRTSCAVERKADLNVIINTNFVVPGGRPLVHVVNECPRDYYVAYLTRRGWPLLDTFNWNIIIFLEAGLIQKWYEVTENAIIDHYRLTTPNEDESLKPLSLIDIQTSFFILGFGLAVCTFVFLWELLTGKCTMPTDDDDRDLSDAARINNRTLFHSRQVLLN